MKNIYFTITRWVYRLAAVGVSALALLVFPLASMAQGADESVAKAVSVQGTVEVQPAGQSQWQPVKLNDTFRPGDKIRVQERSRADIAMLNQSVLRLNANSTITVEAPKEQKTGVVALIRGAAHFFSRGPNSLEVNTPFTVAGVRGTEFYINLEPEATQLTVFEGTVVAENPSGSLTIRDGQSAVAQAGKAPVERTVVRPRDAVQWTLYYPPVIQDQKAPAYQAQMLLAVGAVDEARGAIRNALQTAPNNADALSVQSIMTLVQGDKDQALQLAQSAVQAAPNSASALVARSYAEQARFDLPAARASAQQAVDAEPNNALAWARLAELHSSFGELDKAKAAAQKAVEADPNLSRTQTVLGFAQLTTIDINGAKQSFEKAITLDQADPLPRLGLGLAKIRGGDLDAGSREIEVAASLDPGNALVRSYLGKAYFEEKRSPRDAREYGVAKQLDPKDPTPWFYDAIAKQTTNRPIEALQDVEKARELNDNRAVYRSQLLLDSDNAARAASQARIYADLGFQQRALVEGWNSVNTDPTNFSAHRFLADSYSVLPRHEIARVSELLQSQLLAPVTLTPLQPQLAEANLFLISSGGPGTASFNEFNPIFNRNGMTFQGSGLAGSNGTGAGDIVVAGLYDKLAFSAGYSRFRTDGFRNNNDQADDIGNVFVQYDFTPRTSLQAEYRNRRLETGEIQQTFFPESFSEGHRKHDDDIESVRVGGRHAFSPASTIIGSVVYQNAKFRESFDEPPLLANLNIPQRGYSGEVQHLYRSDFVNVRSGLGYADTAGDITANVRVDIPPPDGPIEFQIVSATDTQHLNLYSYADFKLLKNLTATVGASYDSLQGDLAGQPEKNQFNPKLGVTWNPLVGTTVRAAAFRAMKRTLITNQTLEPTQVAGFNQFYDDYNLTESWRYGAAVDQKFGKTLFGGLEFSRRDLKVPYLDATTEPAASLEADWNEDLARAYLFWTPHPWWALRAEYVFEKFEHDDQFADGLSTLDTHRVPLSVRLFHPSGFSASLTTTYWNQKGEFGGDPPFVSGKDDFWLVDAALVYRLPKRNGLISVGVSNLFDKEFKYYQIDANNSTIQPKRTVFARFTLAFP